MENLISVIQTTRENFIQLVKSLSIEQLNRIPEGFSNNIIWNFAHIMSSQQTLCYRLSGLTPVLGMTFITEYSKRTRPERNVDQDELEQFIVAMRTTIDDLASDYNQGKFSAYQPYTTQFGFQLNNIDDAVQFFALHDSMHLGYAMALRKVLISNK